MCSFSAAQPVAHFHIGIPEDMPFTIAFGTS